MGKKKFAEATGFYWDWENFLSGTPESFAIGRNTERAAKAAGNALSFALFANKDMAEIISQCILEDILEYTDPKIIS